ncbi:Piso0_003064 [Millerozyma farinosa CBS 7064]|uniref:Piso0_003064 protein n=1 Tax=Pichia sorbitophila (strain ATCC MYA-4447 / BCRC 22081 / CBS 7064 / NBRC 10061 / NRRL Y-12695) TaxID=559304 RepID=G8YK91_PICSO|nr:Piso0_003064 [Millerozyma farinosa CBS 7064]CCE80736.1 Piso0_003064 [Millerozyma farinosa CBS 7064]
MNGNYNDVSSLPPSIRLTPSAEEERTQKPRSRAGTISGQSLGSNANNFGIMGTSLGSNMSSVNSNIGSIKMTPENASPLIASSHSDSLVLPQKDAFSLGLSSPPISHGIDIPNGSGTTRRMRSASLFSTNSIWNDDNVSLHSPSHNPSNFLDGSSVHMLDLNNPSSTPMNHNGVNNNDLFSPLLTTSSNGLNSTPNSNPSINNPQMMSSTQRNRSYTTAGVPYLNLSSLPIQKNKYNIDLLNGNRSNSVTYGSAKKTNEMNILLDNLLLHSDGPGPLNQTRHRSQTFSGPTPLSQDPIANQMHANQNTNISSDSSQKNLTHSSQALGGSQPLLQDGVDFSQLILTTNFENPNMSPTRFLLFDNIPDFLDASKLWSILMNAIGNNRSLGVINSIRISSTSAKLALVECNTLDLAMNLKAGFNHLELLPGVVLFVAFAKLVDNSNSSSGHTKSPETSNLSKNNSIASHDDNSRSSSFNLSSIQNSLLSSIHTLSNSMKDIDIRKIISIINKSISYPKENYQDNFGPLPDPIPSRQFDAPKLRELRKVLENSEQVSNKNGDAYTTSDPNNKVLTQIELEELCLAMLDELPELCYDYLGNTIVQKVFLLVKSPLIKLMMVKEIAPYLTQLGIHKNGTWAIQKIINLCDQDYQQMYLISASLKPFSVKLFNDQFGNYVLQGCLKFGSPFNDFIFETLLDNFLEISFGRFGARCIRTILETANENKYITNEQVILVTGLIVEFANELVVNANGSLLITWFLDTFNGCGATEDTRYMLLTRKFLPILDVLCVHKLANLTILKILNNRSDPRSKQLIMDAIFGPFDESEDESQTQPPKLLEDILREKQENSAGALFIYKILSNPLILVYGDETNPIKNSRYQHFLIQRIKRVLLSLNITNLQPYKKLIDEVGLSNSRLGRSLSVGNRKGKRGNRNAHMKMQGSQTTIPPMVSPGGHAVVNASASVNQSHYNMGHSQFQQQPAFSYMVPPQNMVPMMQQGPPPPPPIQQQGYSNQYDSYGQPQDMAVIQQLEQLSLSSAALGYNSNPGTPGVNSSQKASFF